MYNVFISNELLLKTPYLIEKSLHLLKINTI